MNEPLVASLAGVARLLSGITIRWVGCRPDTRQRVYFGNHTSHLDSLVLWSALPPEVRALARPVAAKDYWGTGKLHRRLVTWLFQAVLIERHCADAAERHRQSELLLEAMGERYSLIVFPEGTRGRGPEIAPFKSGLYHLSLKKPGLELVPVHLENLNRILPKGEFLPVPLLSSITFGHPIRVLDGEPKDVFLERAREAVRSLKAA